MANKKWPENITLRGLHFRHANWATPPGGQSTIQAESNLGAAIYAVGARDCVLEASSISQIGEYAVWLATGCKRNRIDQCEMTDLGGGDGNHLHHNLIHDIDSYGYGSWGIYFDEGTTNMLAENNVVHHTKSAGFHEHYGKNNTVRSNTPARCRAPSPSLNHLLRCRVTRNEPDEIFCLTTSSESEHGRGSGELRLECPPTSAWRNRKSPSPNSQSSPQRSARGESSVSRAGTAPALCTNCRGKCKQCHCVDEN